MGNLDDRRSRIQVRAHLVPYHSRITGLWNDGKGFLCPRYGSDRISIWEGGENASGNVSVFHNILQSQIELKKWVKVCNLFQEKPFAGRLLETLWLCGAFENFWKSFGGLKCWFLAHNCGWGRTELAVQVFRKPFWNKKIIIVYFCWAQLLHSSILTKQHLNTYYK